MERDEELIIQPDESTWKPGDPCGICGSTLTGWSSDPSEGAVCFGCGGQDFEG